MTLPAALTHRYSFNESSGTVATDSVGGAHGTLENGAFLTGTGLVEFDGTDDFVDLPDNLVAGYNIITIETWLADFGSPDWARVFDFGRRVGTVGDAWIYLGYPPAAVTGGQPSIRAEVNPPVSILNAPRPSVNTMHHVALVIDGPATTARIYVDGALAAVSRSFAGSPATIGAMTNVWIGQSQFAADARFYGLMDEFRIWNEALNAAQIAASAQAGPDTVNTNPGALTNLTLGVVSPMVLGGVQTPTVIGYYSNLSGGVNVIAEPDLVLTSSNPSVIVVTNFTTLQAVGLGTATIYATLGGKVASQPITVIAEPATLIHRYPFNETGGTVIQDVVGGAHGTVVSGTLGGGKLELNGLGDYATLPAGILSGLTNATFQFWVRWDGNNPSGQTRFFDFGTNNGSAGVRWFQVTPNGNNIANRWGRIQIQDGSGGGDQNANTTVATPTNVFFNVTVVFNDSANWMRLYYNGQLVAQNTAMTMSLYRLGDAHNYLGRGQWAVDPTMIGAFDEFRIFKGAMSDFEVAVTAAAGPQNVVTNPGALLAVRIVPGTTSLDAHGDSTPYTVYADYSNVSNVNVTSVSGLVVTTSDPTVVNPVGATLQPAGAGVATVTATFQSVSGSVAISVTDTSAWPTILHRYRFNEGSGAAVLDSIGGAHGTVVGAYSRTAERLVVPGGPATPPGNNPAAGYVDLPNGLITNLPPETSFEAWVVWQGGGIWQRVFDFGTSTCGEDCHGTGWSYLMLTPSGGGGVARAEYYYNGTSQLALTAPSQFTPGALTHVVLTHDATRQRARLYINGQRIASGAVTNLLTDLPPVNNWLGRAQWADPYFNGEFEEFRIWKGALTDAQVAANFAAGPQTLPGPQLRIRPAGANVELLWPANATPFALQASPTLGPGATWTNVPGTPSVVNGWNVLPVAPAASTLFYRLQP